MAKNNHHQLPTDYKYPLQHYSEYFMGLEAASKINNNTGLIIYYGLEGYLKTKLKTGIGALSTVAISNTTEIYSEKQIPTKGRSTC
jgi:hypothetical protein